MPVESVITAECVEEKQSESQNQARGQNTINLVDVPELNKVRFD